VDLLGGWAGCGPQVACESLAEVIVDTQCLGDVVAREECAHEQPVAALSVWLEADQGVKDDGNSPPPTMRIPQVWGGR